MNVSYERMFKFSFINFNNFLKRTINLTVIFKYTFSIFLWVGYFYHLTILEVLMMEERIYTIPLRDVINKSVRTKRAPRAIKKIKQFLKRHMKAEIVKIDNELNEKIWERGIQKPPARVRVKAVKEGNVVTATLAE